MDYTPETTVITNTIQAHPIINSVIFKNDKQAAPPFGNLVIDNTVTGNGGDPTKPFRFTIVIGNDPNKVYNFEGSKTGTIRSGDVVELTHGQRIDKRYS